VSKHVLIIFGGHAGGRTRQLVEAVERGVRLANDDTAQQAIEIRTLPALEAGIEDLLWANALLIGTPEHFGYMAGAIKDFMDRTFYPAEGKVEALPYAVFVSAGNDGTGAVTSIERIALGYKWKQVAEPLIVKGEVTEADLQRCVELGQTIAVGLDLGIF
jgi:NAD(P)H-dependent FMN reductase